MRRWFLTILFIVSLLGAGPVLGAMSSTNYYIYADVVSVGGVLSTSTSYGLQDTVGESLVGVSTSSTYQISSGYQYMDRAVGISMSVSNSSLDLGSLIEYTASSTAATTVSVDSGSDSGFSLSISGVTGSVLSNVIDGQVDGVLGIDTSAEEYGLGVTGTNAAFVGDAAVTNGLVLASSTSPTACDTVLTFKVIRNASTTPGTYSQSITLSASANF